MRNSPQLKEEGKKTTHSDGGFAYEGAPVESLCSDDDFRWIDLTCKSGKDAMRHGMTLTMKIN